METKLKPCPFCGGEAELDIDNFPLCKNIYRGHCYNFDSCDFTPKGIWHKSETDAIKAWNKRCE